MAQCDMEAKVGLLNIFVHVLYFYPGTYTREQSQQSSGPLRFFFFLTFLQNCSRITVTLGFC